MLLAVTVLLAEVCGGLGGWLALVGVATLLVLALGHAPYLTQTVTGVRPPNQSSLVMSKVVVFSGRETRR